MSFFGFTAPTAEQAKKKQAPQPRHRGRVDLEDAHREVADVLAVWRQVSLWPDAAPFDGGVWDSWPQRLAQGVAFLKAESAAVLAYLRHEEAAHGS